MHTALCGDHHRYRHGHVDFHEQPSSGRLRHGHPHDSADGSVFGPASTCFNIGRECPSGRFGLANDLLHAFQRGGVHQSSSPGSHGAGHGVSRLLHTNSVDSEHDWPEKAGEVAIRSLQNIFWLGLKELRSLSSDLVMIAFVIYAFTGAIYIAATGTSNEVNNASIAFVDEDGSTLSKELFNA